jgi:hypothetical protein
METALTAIIFRDMLKRLEWVKSDNGTLYGPVCECSIHKPDCELAALLKEG